MSLELAAQHLASRGRKGDSMLVHMAPQEVSGLQALAKAHGGSLTVNPDTGLAEANFLRNFLPTLIGAGLSIASGGTLTPLMAAGITGAGYGVATGSLQKGLMAGLGAYGGAGLAGGLTAAAGTVGAEAAAGAAGAGVGAGGTTAIDAAMANALPASSGAAAPAAGLGGSSFAQASQAANAAAANNAVNTTMTNALPLSGNAGLAPQVATATPMPAMTSVGDRFAQAGRGFGALGTEAGREAFMGNAASKGVAASGVGGGMGLMKSAYAAATPMMMQDPAKQGQREEEKPYEYDFDFGRVTDPNARYTGASTGERRYFDPRFTRRAADGGLMNLGTVQAMSDRNMAQTIAANGGQGYATGGLLRDVVERLRGVFPDPVTPMPGNNSAVSPVEQDPYYTMSGQSGDAFKYLMGQAPSSRAVAPVGGAGIAGLSAAGGTEYDYTFDPVTNRYSRTPRPIDTVADAGSGVVDSGGGGGDSAGGDAGPGSGVGVDGGVAAAPGDFGAVGDGDGSSDGDGGVGDSGPGGSSGVGGDSGAAAGPGGDGDGGSAAAGDGDGWARGGLSPSSRYHMAQGGLSALAMAQGGQPQYNLGGYSDGGRLLKGPGDGVSDSIPATIGNRQPARLADGEFVVPARIVSELGNGSTEAGARKLYAMMDRIQKARKKSIGKNRVAVNSKTEKMLPA